MINEGAHTFHVPVKYQKTYLSKDDYRNLYSMGLDWTYQYGPKTQTTVYSQLGQLRYDNQSESDVRLALVGGTWAYSLAPTPVVVSMSPYYGNEHALKSAGSHNSRDFYGLLGAIQWFALHRHTLYTTANIQYSDFRHMHSLFGKTRHETLWGVSSGWKWQQSQQVSYVLDASYLDNDSNIEIYTYDRWVLMATLRYDF